MQIHMFTEYFILFFIFTATAFSMIAIWFYRVLKELFNKSRSRSLGYLASQQKLINDYNTER